MCISYTAHSYLCMDDRACVSSLRRTTNERLSLCCHVSSWPLPLLALLPANGCRLMPALSTAVERRQKHNRWLQLVCAWRAQLGRLISSNLIDSQYCPVDFSVGQTIRRQARAATARQIDKPILLLCVCTCLPRMTFGQGHNLGDTGQRPRGQFEAEFWHPSR